MADHNARNFEVNVQRHEKETDMSDIKEEKTEEVVEVKEEQTEPELPTADDVKAKGWSAKEIELAEKRGMLAKPKEKKVEDVKKDVVVEEKPVKVDEKPVEEKNKSTLPDFEINDPAKERVFLDTFGVGTPQRAMYFRMKNERQARQRAQSELKAEREARAALEARISSLESQGKKEVDENGNEIDPEDKPLTLKQWKELQRSEQEQIMREQERQRERANSVVEAQKIQEDYARSIYPDFEDTMNKAAEVMRNLETMVPDKWKQAKAIKLIKELQTAAANADKIDLDDYHGAMIAYEIGQLHPSYGKQNGQEPKREEVKETGTLKDPKANGSLTPEQMKRIEENNSRRASSASVSGGVGKRSVDAEDVGLPELNAMTYVERQKFREKHPERYAKLLRS